MIFLRPSRSANLPPMNPAGIYTIDMMNMNLPASLWLMFSLPVRYRVMKGNTNIPTELTTVTKKRV